MAGSITAALYLERFVPAAQPWAHVDVYAWNDNDRPGRPAGGEEFTLIQPEAPLEAALQRAEAIRAGVETMRVKHMGRDLPQVTVSIGVATFPADGDSPEALLRVADEALYRAKHSGRNRVEQAPL
jgi:diguanylate cyclase (GGDEF)-like protein